LNQAALSGTHRLRVGLLTHARRNSVDLGSTGADFHTGMPDVRVNERKPGRTTRGVMKLSFMLWGRRILWARIPLESQGSSSPANRFVWAQILPRWFFYQRVAHP